MLFVQTFSKGFIVFDYFTNTGAYAKDCVNKDKPWMHCNGKCQMMKKMQQEDKKDQDNPDRKTDGKNETVLSSKSFFASLTVPASVPISSPQKYAFIEGISAGLPLEIFHPPQGC